MSFDISVAREAQHTRVTIKGQATAGQLASLFEVLHVDSADWAHQEVLIDMAELRGPFTPAEQAQLAQRARHSLHPKRVTLRWAGGP